MTDIDEQWPEADVRQRRWVAAEEAPAQVLNDGLRTILERVPESVAELFPDQGRFS